MEVGVLEVWNDIDTDSQRVRLAMKSVKMTW